MAHHNQSSSYNLAVSDSASNGHSNTTPKENHENNDAIKDGRLLPSGHGNPKGTHQDDSNTKDKRLCADGHGDDKPVIRLKSQKAENVSPPQQKHKNKEKPLPVDVSKANIIATPKQKDDKVKDCFRFIDILKQSGYPSGVYLVPDSGKLRLGEDGLYEEGRDYTIMHTFKMGSNALKVCVVKDIWTGHVHVLKKISLSDFRKNEIKAMEDLQSVKDIFVPEIYLFYVRGNSVHIHMELIENGTTLREVIDSKIKLIRSSQPLLVRPLTLFILHDVMSAVLQMHARPWTHNGLHGENILIQQHGKSIRCYIIDLGKAYNLMIREDEYQRDKHYLAILVLGLYTGKQLINDWDFTGMSWEDKLKESSFFQQLYKSEQDELLDTINRILNSKSQTDRQQILEYLQQQFIDIDMETMFHAVNPILFPKDHVQSPVRYEASTTQTSSNWATSSSTLVLREPEIKLSTSITSSQGQAAKCSSGNKTKTTNDQEQNHGTPPAPRTNIERVLKTGCMPLLPPARRAWGEKQVDIGLIHWPPQDWQTLTGKKKLDKLVYAAITLDGGDAATTKPSIPFLLDKYNMLRLPGTEIPDMNIDAGKPSDMASIAKMSRYSTFHIIREMCCSESHSTNQLNLLKQVEAAWSVRDKTTDDITSRLDSAGVDLQLEDI
ncbi:uncharacterized protein LOC117321388 [Pecten maximus]|uniref:uncharacterized protein LOC117321388 n=1 Tax=Pecten maximus TaxID=6579 RepID=UPI001458C245|nr:uncharacterized protein LOC117321388 [Pecten maximus]